MNSDDANEVNGSLEAGLEETCASRRRFLSAVVTGTVVVAAADGLAAAVDISPENSVQANTSAQLEAVLSRYGSEFGHVRRIR